jgi:O-acetyl-ADP-ribose deacetylase (regulator of RNase III)
MIQYIKGNILESEAQALVNTVNTMGIMGKGIALQFKKAFPDNFRAYQNACKRKEVVTGKLFVTKDGNLNTGTKIIINFPTKNDWRKSSEYSYIEDGLDDFIQIVEKYQLRSVAFPPLGAGNGGLEWGKVKSIIEQKLNGLDVDIFVYEPTDSIREHLKNNRLSRI